MLSKLGDDVEYADASSDVCVLIVAGREPSFSSGHDLSVDPTEESTLKRPIEPAERLNSWERDQISVREFVGRRDAPSTSNTATRRRRAMTRSIASRCCGRRKNG
jgi:hypothetical protein